MGVIKATLFRHLKFHATQDQVTRLQQTTFASFGAHVKIVTFVPSPYCADVSLEDFKNILLVQQVHLAYPEPTHCSEDPLEHAKRVMKGCWGWRLPMPDREVSALFRNYQDFARDDSLALLNGQMQHLWTMAFETFHNIDQVKISPEVRCLPHMIEPASRRYDCHPYLDFHSRVAAGSGDILFAAVAQCLATAQTRVNNFSIDCPLKLTFADGWKDAWWDKLDLLHVRTIHVENYPVFDTEDEDETLNGALWLALLKKVEQSVQDVKIINGLKWDEMVMSSFSDLRFPSIRTLCLQGVAFGATTFARTINRSPKLRELTLERCVPYPSPEEWKPALDAIRQHKRSLKVDFVDVFHGEGDWSFAFRKAPNGNANKLPIYYGGDAPDDLLLYLCNKGPWTPLLEEWLHGY